MGPHLLPLHPPGYVPAAPTRPTGILRERRPAPSPQGRHVYTQRWLESLPKSRLHPHKGTVLMSL